MSYINHASFIEALKELAEKTGVEELETIIIGCNYYMIRKDILPSRIYNSTLRCMYMAEVAVAIEGDSVELLKFRGMYSDGEACFTSRGISTATHKRHSYVDEE